MRAIHAVFALVFLPLASACVGQTPAARGQEAANELNTNQRFGRTELLAERVADTQREKFFERRKTWGSRIQIADSEMLSFKMRGNDQADVYLHVSWYKVDEGNLHQTTLKQSWKDFKGSWKLTDESRSDGDLGLLGEAAPMQEKAKTEEAPAQTRNAARFLTVKLGGPPPETTMANTIEEKQPAEEATEPPAAPAAAPVAPATAATTATTAATPAEPK